MSNHNNTDITLKNPGPFPYMATIAEENEWLMAMNDYEATNAADKGYTYYVKGLRNGSPSATIIWWVKETLTDRPIDGFEDRMEALKALDAMEAQS